MSIKAGDIVKRDYGLMFTCYRVVSISKGGTAWLMAVEKVDGRWMRISGAHHTEARVDSLEVVNE
jgi:hypothetical protein